MTAISKNIYYDALDDIVKKNNNTVHRTIKMKAIDVTDNSFAEYNEESNKKDATFKVDDHVRISNTKIYLLKDILLIGQKKFLLLIKLIMQFLGHTAISDLNGEEITGSFYEKELQSTNQQKFRIKNIIRRKGNKLYVKWKGYNNSFNSWINKKDIL